MGAMILDLNGRSVVMGMGCYGIGITRIVAAAIEQNNDPRGIVWPMPMAPFAVALAPVGYDRSATVKALADKLHDELEAAGIEVLLDDRGERPGVMFADLELIGVPHRVTIGDRGLKDGNVEYQSRRDGSSTGVAVDSQLVLGLIQHESNFRKYAVSIAGARGYMQVMPFWVKLIGNTEHDLFSLRTNLRYGCLILRRYLDQENGDIFRALGRYNGSLGRPDYPTAVVAAWQRNWAWNPTRAVAASTAAGAEKTRLQ